MKLSATRLHGIDLVKVTGEIDITTVGDLEDFFSELDAPTLVIDLTEVTFMDTSVVHFLLRTSNRADGGERDVRLVVTPRRSVHVLLKLTGLIDQFTIVESADELALPLDEHR